ncbi:MAG TPA: glycoside hydrolase family 18 protein [Pilimelia sp.]|nr:glycoside hydrolase family 18 protein [Pilimelia sp.]
MRRSSLRRFAVAGAALTVLLTGASVPVQAASSGQAATHGKSGKHQLLNVGYFTQWGIYDRKFYVKNLVTSGAIEHLTHINYAFGDVNAEGKCTSSDAWADYQRPVPAEESVDGVADTPGGPLNGNLGQLRKLKAKYPKLRIMISLGGWVLSDHFSDAVLTPQARRKFAESCVDLWLKGNLPKAGAGQPGGRGVGAGVFDGIDIDWEFPGWPGEPGNTVRPEDKQNLTLAVAEFRRQLDAYGRKTRKKYELTAFVPANPGAIDAGFEVKKLARYLDFITLQGYDYHGGWNKEANHQSALRLPEGGPKPDYSGETTVQAWESRGMPRSKLVLGIPYYGRGWTGITGGGNGLWQPATGPAPATYEAGYEDYKILAGLQSKGYTLYRDIPNGHAWLFDGTTFWTFDDPYVVLQKATYIRDHKLRGAMVWSLDGDDANATLTKTIGYGLRGR